MKRTLILALAMLAWSLSFAACEDEPSPTPAGQGLPCDVVAILQQHCVACHGAVPQRGAPLSLVTPADFQALGNDGATVGSRVLVRVQDSIRPMPPPPNPRLTQAELSTLTTFVRRGARPVANGCALEDPSATDSSGGSGSGSSMGSVGGTGGVPVSGTSRWTVYGHDLANSRANLEERILSAQNVSRLRRRWEFRGPATTSTPAVFDGVVYLPGWDGKVYALRLADGSALWTATLPNLIDSSAAVSSTRVFVSDNKGSVHAIDRRSGSIQWSTQVDSHPQAHLWSSPVYIEDANLVVVGVASGEEELAAPYTFRGSVVALNAATGAVVWQFLTTRNDRTSGPGVAVWSTAAVDTERKTLYLGTGNNYAGPAGPYADAMLAIDYTSGRLVWSHQFTANDIFTIRQFLSGPDSDVGSSANLFTAGGRDLLGIGVKNGLYYALDRDTGRPVWTAELTTGSVLGGVISASAYANGVAYVASNRFTEGLTDVVALDVSNGRELWRTTLSEITYGGVAYANGVVYLGNDSAKVFALNAATGATLWTDRTPNAIGSGATVADGLLLVSWGYQWTLGRGNPGSGGLIAYGL